jgi:hypothetical protein
MDHRLGLAPLGRAESALGCRLVAPVHPVRPGVWHTPPESAGSLASPPYDCKPSLKLNHSPGASRHQHRRADIPVRSKPRTATRSGLFPSHFATSNLAADRNVRAPVLVAMPRYAPTAHWSSPIGDRHEGHQPGSGDGYGGLNGRDARERASPARRCAEVARLGMGWRVISCGIGLNPRCPSGGTTIAFALGGLDRWFTHSTASVGCYRVWQRVGKRRDLYASNRQVLRNRYAAVEPPDVRNARPRLLR